MARKPEHDYQLKLSASYICPKTKATVNLELSEHDISSGEQECELCGSHGSVDIEINKCPSCGKYHSICLRSW